MKTEERTPAERKFAFRVEMLTLLRRHAGELPADELLAISAHLVGQILALQDQRTMTPERALRIVQENIEQGNREAIEGSIGETMGSA